MKAGNYEGSVHVPKIMTFVGMALPLIACCVGCSSGSQRTESCKVCQGKGVTRDGKACTFCYGRGYREISTSEEQSRRWADENRERIARGEQPLSPEQLRKTEERSGFWKFILAFLAAVALLAVWGARQKGKNPRSTQSGA